MLDRTGQPFLNLVRTHKPWLALPIFPPMAYYLLLFTNRARVPNWETLAIIATDTSYTLFREIALVSGK